MLVRTMRIRGVVQVGILYGPTLRRVSFWIEKRGRVMVPEVRVRLVCFHYFCRQKEEHPYTVAVSKSLYDSINPSDIPRAHH